MSLLPSSDLVGFNRDDTVVHEVYGIGRYLGIEQRSGCDFLKLEYADSSYLFVPVHQVSLVSLYIGNKSRKFSLSQLGKTGAKEWSKSTQKVKNKIKDISQKLKDLYQKRISGSRPPYFLDMEVEKSNCPFDLTDDQESAMAAIRCDLSTSSPMSRLICGDPGFGKTELAIRTALHIIAAKKQVIFLCPTTILSEQHFNVFVKRLSASEISIAKLNRFSSSAEYKRIQNDFPVGKISILIGTHRVLADKIIPADLGLLIIDEEQKFGVAQKEKVRNTFPLVDTLYLSATPIPRTVHSALIGMGNVSLIRTPPKGRKQIQSFIKQFDEQEVQSAICNELQRDGQIFFVNDKIDGLEILQALACKFVDPSRVAIIHGQMDKNYIESTMYRFVTKQLDILVTTNIVESGLDISNVNTIIVNNAQNFGLSQLYQLRGRVGRSSRQGYVYFFTSQKHLSDEARERLDSIQQLTHLGQGFEIAMRDLEIRGVGDIFGEEQSGYVSDVGYQLYCKWLGQELQQKNIEQTVQVEFSRSWNIPNHYIHDEATKLRIYSRIVKENSVKSLQIFKNQLIRQFGNPPKEIDFLFLFSTLVIVAQERAIVSIKDRSSMVEIYPSAESKLFVEKILQDQIWSSYIKCSESSVCLYLSDWINPIQDPLEKEICKVQKTRECIESFWGKI